MSYQRGDVIWEKLGETGSALCVLAAVLLLAGLVAWIGWAITG